MPRFMVFNFFFFNSGRDTRVTVLNLLRKLVFFPHRAFSSYFANERRLALDNKCLDRGKFNLDVFRSTIY